MSSISDLYPDSKSPGEISLRNEFINTFDGYSLELPKARINLVRIMRRDSAGDLIPCECVDSVTHEPDKDRLCPICLGEGWKWDEQFEELYKVLVSSKELQMEPGLINTPVVTFYMRYNTAVTFDDKIIELILDAEGQPVQPYKRLGVYRIQDIQQLRLDNARIEYLKIFAYRQDVKHLNRK